MKRFEGVPTVLIALCLVCAASTALSFQDQKPKLTLDQIPAAARATIEKESAGAPLDQLKTEMQNGKTVYVAEWETDGDEVEIWVAEDGKVVAREVEISMSDVPPAVRATIEQQTKGAKVDQVEKFTRPDGKVVYEVEWMVEGKKREIVVAEDGKLVSR